MLPHRACKWQVPSYFTINSRHCPGIRHHEVYHGASCCRSSEPTAHRRFLYVIPSAPRSSPGAGNPQSHPHLSLPLPQEPEQNWLPPHLPQPSRLRPQRLLAWSPHRRVVPASSSPAGTGLTHPKGTLPSSCVHCAAHLSSHSVPISLQEL